MKNFKVKIQINSILKISYLFVLACFALDILFYQGFFQNNLKIPLSLILIIVAIFHIVLRKNGYKLGLGFAITNLLVIAPMSIISTSLIHFAENSSWLFPNYFFVTFGIDYHSIVSLFLPSVVFGLLHSSKTFWRSTWQYLFFLYTILSMIYLSFLYYSEIELFQKLNVEDGLVEYLTALMFFVSGLVGLALSRLLKQSKLEYIFNLKKIVIVGLTIISLGLIIVSFEEISWGQRIFNFQTPSALEQTNLQGEINFHNSTRVWPFVYLGYLAIGLYGAFAWVGVWLLTNEKQKSKELDNILQLLIPKPYLLLNFVMIAIYVLLREKHGYWKFRPWEEFCELLLIIAIFAHLIQNYLHLSLIHI